MAKRTKPAKTSGEQATAKPGAPQMSPEVAKKIAAIRASVRESFGKVVMAMMLLPRYRNQTIADLQHLVLEPLLRDRLAIAYPGKPGEGETRDMTGFALWASVSEDVDARIRDQIRGGAFPVRLQPDDWDSGQINWLLDVVATSPKATAQVIANFRQVAKEGTLRLHPVVTRMLDKETLEKMGAAKLSEATPGGDVIAKTEEAGSAAIN